MKKKLLFSVLILFSVFILMGCSKNMTGTYKMVEMREGKSLITEKTLKELDIKYILEVKKDGEAVMNLAGEKIYLTYNDKYFIYKADTKDKIEYTYKDGKITMSQDGTLMVFKLIK